MIPRACPRIFTLLLLAHLGADRATCLGAGAVNEEVIQLSVAEEPADDPGRVFSVPVICNGQDARFALGAFGSTRISASFAERCHSRVEPDSALNRHVASGGDPIYAGAARVKVRLGGREQSVLAAVMNDKFCQLPEREGVLGFDVIRAFQWEIDASAATLTLRPPGAPLPEKSLAVLPLRIGEHGCSVKIKVRNATEWLVLMPGSSFVQAGPALQRKWDLVSGEKTEPEVQRFGDVRTVLLRGQDAVELSPALRETDLRVALIGDAHHPDAASDADSGLGQCVLNRYVYCVDLKRQKLTLIRRLTDDRGRPIAGATRPAE